MKLDFSLVYEYIPFLLEASVLTIEISILSIIVSIILGLITAMMKISRFKVLNKLAQYYINFIRGTPLLAQLYLVYFGLPQMGIELNEFVSSIIGLGLNGGAYVAEIFRGSIMAIPNGQMEAARSLGMSYPTAMRKVILPQAFRFSLPPLGNQFIIILKDSSLCSVITAEELMHSTNRFASVNFAYLEFFIAASLLYYIMTYMIAKLISRMEKRLSVSERSSQV